MNTHTAGHWWAGACLLALAALFAAVAWGGKACEWLLGRLERRIELRDDRKAARKARRLESMRRHPGQVPGRPVDGNALTAAEEDALAAAQYLLTKHPLASEPKRPARRQP